ncbi:MAG TPA: DUF4293 domain-containing protein [Flavobacteriaceae bacterium]|nr:DUF4293 domain-containing protein [Flavobacteriaceae bacterium]
MIQRVQSIYLFITALIYGFASILIPEWNFEGKDLILTYDESAISYIYLGLAIFALVIIFLFKNRKTQIRLIRLNILLNVILLGFFVYWFLSLPGGSDFNQLFSEKGIGILFPIISIVFLRMAGKAIKKDEDLVKSVNRFR